MSGQSVAVSHDVQIDVHEKDFRSKTLIKEAIMENDFLKNLSPSQVIIELAWALNAYPLFSQISFIIS